MPLLLALLVLLAATPVRLEETRTAMGTQFTIVAYGKDRTQIETAFNEAFEEITRLDREWSNYRSDSDISRLNVHADAEPVRVDPELFRMLQTSLRFSRETEGAFDVTVGPLLKTWGFFKGEGHLPPKEQIDAVQKRVGWRKVLLDEKERTVKFAVEDMEIDLGGIAKGYAVDRAAAVLKDAGIEAALIISGSSSVLAVGAPPGEAAWTMRVRDPKDSKKFIAEIPLKDAGMSTSGSYEKFFKADGKIYSHIFDPRTGYPAQGTLSVTLVGPDGISTDALSTAFFVLGKEKTREYLRSHPGLRVFYCIESGCEWLN